MPIVVSEGVPREQYCNNSCRMLSYALRNIVVKIRWKIKITTVAYHNGRRRGNFFFLNDCFYKNSTWSSWPVSSNLLVSAESIT